MNNWMNEVTKSSGWQTERMSGILTDRLTDCTDCYSQLKELIIIVVCSMSACWECRGAEMEISEKS